MIAVVLNGARIGSLLKFLHQPKPWCAYSYNENRESFRTRKEAVAWLAARHEMRAA